VEPELSLYLWHKQKERRMLKATPLIKLSKEQKISTRGLEKKCKRIGSFFKDPVYIKHGDEFLPIEGKTLNVIIEEI